MTEPLHLHFTLADPAVALIQIELANPLDPVAVLPCNVRN